MSTYNEKSIQTINEYFSEIAQNAVTMAYDEVDDETTFAEFIENVMEGLSQLAAEHVATEALGMSVRSVERYNDGAGMTVDDIQALIDEKDDEDGYDDDEEEDDIEEL